MGLLDRVKEQAEQTAAKAREGVEDVQAKRELSQAYNELGKSAYALVQSGEISHEELEPAVQRISALIAETVPSATPTAS
jgi:uncharacterized protein YoxC